MSRAWVSHQQVTADWARKNNEIRRKKQLSAAVKFIQGHRKQKCIIKCMGNLFPQRKQKKLSVFSMNMKINIVDGQEKKDIIRHCK